jgi:hypothetical protein
MTNYTTLGGCVECTYIKLIVQTIDYFVFNERDFQLAPAAAP